jgi:hypothetical protein
MNPRATIYTAKCYWPGVTEAEIVRVAENVGHLARSREESPINCIGTIFFPADELVLYLFEASTRAAVRQASERAGMPCERIMESVWLTGPGTRRQVERA